ncbi:thermonuclease family protein [Synechococcus sp. GFB01]|uniref:thermonuclease family protein n=1 Tax=Synechococcus sp. GFB01 TaxID=1662190 RepID=UPI0009082557|nr:thermonuclease family protein [Synechococcus sp. GFB01]
MARLLHPLFLGLVALVPAAAAAQSLRAVVLSIGDGDTLRVRQAGRAVTVRLACIDAPETAQSPWGQQARRYLQQRLAVGRQVTLDIKTTDRYGRTVAEVFSDSNIGLAMVEDGQAFVYRRHLDGCDAQEYLDAEVRASRRRYGIWQVPGGISRPWDFGRNAAGLRLTAREADRGRSLEISEPCVGRFLQPKRQFMAPIMM